MKRSIDSNTVQYKNNIVKITKDNNNIVKRAPFWFLLTSVEIHQQDLQ